MKTPLVRVARLVLVVATVPATGLVDAAAQSATPAFGQLSNTTEMDTLSYDCLLSGATLNCDFTQVKVSKVQGMPDADIATSATQLISEMEQSSQFCDTLTETRALYESGAPIDGIYSEDDRRRATDYLDVVMDLCANPTAAKAEDIFRSAKATTEATCKVGTFPFDLSFTWNVGTSRWETVSQGNGPCGIVTAAHLTLQDNFWVYGQQKFATKRDGTDPLLGSCAEYPNSEMNYTWKPRTIAMQCEFIEYSLF